MRHWMIRAAVTLSAILLVSGLTASWLVRQTQHVPEFYTRATTQLPAVAAEASRTLQADVKRLKADAAQVGSWRARFSDDQINAWLVEELPRKFPRLLARGAQQPRIVIDEGRILAAVRYQDHRVDTVISCEVEVALTEQPNMLAVKISKLKAGALPLPLSKFIGGITKEAACGDLEVRWDFTDEGPIALVTVPSEHPRYVIRPVTVELLSLEQGSLELAGHTGPPSEGLFRPKGEVYQFVSFQPDSNRSHHSSRLSMRRKSAEPL